MRAQTVVGLLCILAVGCGGGMADPDVDTSSSALKKKGPGGRDRCAARAPSAAEQEAIERDLSASAPQGQNTAGVVTVPVYFHVVTDSEGHGNVSALVPAQIQVMNDAYASAGFHFQLVSQEVVANDAWFFSTVGSAEEQDMKASLRQGGANALNLYTTLGDVYLGWATFPVWYRGPLKSYDGVVLFYATLPGTGFKIPDVEEEPDHLIEYDLGDTGTHEVGHWLGLYHTFEGGCNKNGDRIDDTPAEFEPNFFCVENIDSCTGKKFPGVDPIHNFMDYVDDRCMDHFTPEQKDRMQKQWRVYRAKG